jgi:GNAT superfamily N-acetyltransferase
MMSIRRATLSNADIEAIVNHRRAMFKGMGHGDAGALDAMSVRFRPWLQRKMRAGEYLGWFAVSPDGSIVSGVGLWLMEWPPNMVTSGKCRGHILNVYTEPSDRRQGLARCLMQAALAWCAANQVDSVGLHASAAGKPLYDSLGFTPTNEMRLILPSP